MVTVTTDCRHSDGVTLVECRLTNPDTEASRVRLVSQLDGPTWPPRDGAYPAHGWHEGTWTGLIDAGTTLGIGFASPASPVEPPVRLEEVEADTDTAYTGAPSPTDVVRSLSDPRPPRDGLVDGPDVTRDTTDGQLTAPGEIPPETTELGFEAVTDRVERLEALAAASTLPEATVAVADADGLDGVRALCSKTSDDRDRLLALAARAERLAGRIEAADVPIETLERLA